MIKVGILGAEGLMAGELIRLLVHHPEVELHAVCSPLNRGRALSSLHKGIVGDTEIRFTDNVNPEGLDIIFIASNYWKELTNKSIPDALKIVLLQDSDDFEVPSFLEHLEFVPGISEMYRKPLVRGARAARILPSAISVAIIALFPLALHLLLNDTVNIKVRLPKFHEGKISPEGIIRELNAQLKTVQFSFDTVQSVEIEESDTIRALILDIEFNCKISETEIERIYKDIYDDHNFTFVMRNEPSPTEVSGTHKCLLYVTKPTEDRVHIKAVADSVLRGGAGDAIHAMNLLFGLFEKIGLSLPASLAFMNDYDIPIKQ